MDHAHAVSDETPERPSQERAAGVEPTRYLAPVGRVLYAAIFIFAGFHHFSGQAIAYARVQGVPLASVAVPVSGLIALAGGLSVALGYRARLGALLLALFLVPVTLLMHRFWAVNDPAAAQIQQLMFLKNLSMLGAALCWIHAGAGPLSLDARRQQTQTNPG